jgi:hypothetical protein
LVERGRGKEILLDIFSTFSADESERVFFSLFPKKALHMTDGRESDELDLVDESGVGGNDGRVALLTIAILGVRMRRRKKKEKEENDDLLTSEGMTIRAFSPLDRIGTMSSMPSIICFDPRRKLIGCPRFQELSKQVPSSR